MKIKTYEDAKAWLENRGNEPMNLYEKKAVDELILIESLRQHLHNHFGKEEVVRRFNKLGRLEQASLLGGLCRYYSKEVDPSFNPATHLITKVPNFEDQLVGYALYLQKKAIATGIISPEEFNERGECAHDQHISVQIQQSIVLMNQYIYGNE